MLERQTIASIVTKVLFALLVLFGILAINPTILQSLLGEATWARYGLFIIALLTVFAKYYVPRLQPKVEADESIGFDAGSITTFLATALGLFASVAILYPDTIEAFLGEMGLASYTTTAIYVLTAIVDIKFPRNVQLQPEEPEESTA